MADPRIVTPQEAEEGLAKGEAGLFFASWLSLAHTVATEPERIAAAERAAVVKALRDAAEVGGMPEEVQAFATRADRFEVARYLSQRADEIESGAPL